MTGKWQEQRNKLRDALRRLRLAFAKRLNEPVHRILHDTVLERLVQHMPRNQMELLAINGMRPSQVHSLLGRHILQAVAIRRRHMTQQYDDDDKVSTADVSTSSSSSSSSKSSNACRCCSTTSSRPMTTDTTAGSSTSSSSSSVEVQAIMSCDEIVDRKFREAAEQGYLITVDCDNSVGGRSSQRGSSCTPVHGISTVPATANITASGGGIGQRSIAATARRRSTIHEPPGRLGIVIEAYTADCKGTVVSSVGTGSPLTNRIFPGDCIVAINGDDVSLMTVNELSTLLARTSDVPRTLTVLPTPRHTDTSSSTIAASGGGVGQRSIVATARRRNRICTIHAPPGRLGIFIVAYTADCKGTVVSCVGTGSPLTDRIFPGDRIVAINGADVSLLTVNELSTLLARTSDVPRTLTVLTTPRHTDTTSSSNSVEVQAIMSCDEIVDRKFRKAAELGYLITVD